MIAVSLGTAWAVACGDSPIGPTPPPPPEAPSLTCPANITVQSLDGQAVNVNYTPPVAQGGSPPVPVTCAPPSGAFPVGSTTVTCTARDALNRSATCSFSVTVQPPPRLVYTRFLAFGDSLTSGVESEPVRLGIFATAWSYPSKLLPKLRTRYVTQAPTIVVDNVGNPGEFATRASTVGPGGAVRLPTELNRYRPQVVLIMEGTNDLLDTAPEQIIPALESMLITAKGQNVLPMIATIPPQRPGGARDRVAKIIPSFNELIRKLANDQRVPLVDVFAVMSQDLSLIGRDDLHPTVQGYEVMSQIFYDSIVRNLEVRTTSTVR